jgi:SM-20-related protein
MSLDYAALQATPVAKDPFRHVVVPRFVPPAHLGPIVSGLPRLPARGSFPISALRLGTAATALFQELEGPAFREAVAAKFALDLAAAPTMTTLRGQTTERDGKIHTDSLAKRVTVLLYLNPATEAWARREGCLRLLRRPDNLEDYAVEIPPTDGTLLIFPNGPTTWHGHRQFIGQRYVVQLNYMTNDAKARSELRRHRWSALIKRMAA